MKSTNFRVALLVMCTFLVLTAAAWAQTSASPNQSIAPAAASAATEVPRLIKFSGTLLDAQDRPMAGPVGVTFALHAQQTGGAALWIETQNVTPDAHGNYTVLLGANSTHGVPAELFASGEARWLEVQVERQAEQPRILLVSVPYALKAKDAETLGGKPASAFLTTETLAGANNSSGTAAAASTALPSSKAQTTPKKAASTPQPAVACTSVTSDGTATTNSVAKFTSACAIQNSAITETGGKVGIGTAAPAVALDVLGNNAGLRLSGTGTHQVTVTGLSSGRLGQDATGFFFASDTNGKIIKFLTNNGALNEWMRITSAGNVGIGTTTPAFKLDVNGTGNFTGSTTAANTAILGATQSGSTATIFDFTPATVPPVALGGIATATSGNAAGVGGMTSNSSAIGVGALNFASVDGTGLFALSAGSGKGEAVSALESGTSGFTRGIHAIVISSGGVAGLFDNQANSGLGGDLIIGRIGTSGAHTNEFRVDGSGDVLVLGNFHSATAGNGIILKSPDGTICKLLGIANTTGAITLTTVTCPAIP